MKDTTGRDADSFFSGASCPSTFAQAADYLIANVPYGNNWKHNGGIVRDDPPRAARPHVPSARVDTTKSNLEDRRAGIVAHELHSDLNVYRYPRRRQRRARPTS